MGGICGWVNAGLRPEVAASTLEKMASRLAPACAGAIVRHVTDLDALAWHAPRPGLEARTCSDNGIFIALAGDPRCVDSALERQAHERGIARVLAEAYRQRDVELLQLLRGAFALALIDTVKHRALLAIDRMGVSTLSYSLRGEALLFASRCDSLQAHPLAATGISAQSVYDYVYFHMVPGPDTIYEAQQRLAPGEYLLFENGRLSRHKYWIADFDERDQRPFADLKHAFRTALRDSVAEAATGYRCGAFLSGGTDSSTIAGLLTDVQQAPARTYSIGFAEAGYDEMQYARIAAKHFGTDHHEYYVTPEDIVTAIPLIATGFDQPFGNSSAVPTYYCARLARSDGIERMLGGDGGDELFGGNERYAKQRIFSHYERLPGALRKGLIEPIALHLPFAQRLPGLGKAVSYVRQARIPLPGRLETYNLLERFGPANVFHDAFLERVDGRHPHVLLDDIYHGARASSQLNRMLALDWQITLADNDLPKVGGACAIANVEVSYPMLADRVVDFSLHLPSELKLKGTQLRYFFKQALNDFLPQAIIEKQKHGFGLPFGPWLQKHRPLKELALDSLSALRSRAIFRERFLDELTEVKIAEHPGYYGTMVWVLMMLELWLQHHAAGQKIA